MNALRCVTLAAVALMAGCRAAPPRPSASAAVAPTARAAPPPLVPEGAEAQLATALQRLASGGAIRACYERELALEPALKGQVTMRFTVGTGGATSDIFAEEDTLGLSVVVRCLTAEIARWAVVPPPAEPTEFATPFVFTPGR